MTTLEEAYRKALAHRNSSAMQVGTWNQTPNWPSGSFTDPYGGMVTSTPYPQPNFTSQGVNVRGPLQPSPGDSIRESSLRVAKEFSKSGARTICMGIIEGKPLVMRMGHAAFEFHAERKMDTHQIVLHLSILGDKVTSVSRVIPVEAVLDKPLAQVVEGVLPEMMTEIAVFAVFEEMK